MRVRKGDTHRRRRAFRRHPTVYGRRSQSPFLVPLPCWKSSSPSSWPRRCSWACGASWASTAGCSSRARPRPSSRNSPGHCWSNSPTICEARSRTRPPRGNSPAPPPARKRRPDRRGVVGLRDADRRAAFRAVRLRPRHDVRRPAGDPRAGVSPGRGRDEPERGRAGAGPGARVADRPVHVCRAGSLHGEGRFRRGGGAK